jgi:hypothetical protein
MGNIIPAKTNRVIFDQPDKGAMVLTIIQNCRFKA